MPSNDNQPTPNGLGAVCYGGQPEQQHDFTGSWRMSAKHGQITEGRGTCRHCGMDYQTWLDSQRELVAC